MTPDNGKAFAVELSHATLTNIRGQPAKNPDFTITVDRSDLETVMGGKTTFDELVAAGKATFAGDRAPFDRFRNLLVRFTPDFEMMPGTRPPKPAAPKAKDPFELPETGDTSGG